jgi:hypothetical protein
MPLKQAAALQAVPKPPHDFFRRTEGETRNPMARAATKLELDTRVVSCRFRRFLRELAEQPHLKITPKTSLPIILKYILSQKVMRQHFTEDQLAVFADKPDLSYLCRKP